VTSSAPSESTRCPHCDRLLDTPALLQSGECGCRWRPSKHDFDPDPENHGATCLVCGEAFGFGALHREDSTELPDVPEPQICSGCWHPAHSDACLYVKVFYSGFKQRDVLRCSCTVVASAA
jgi:hypothetical protein